ncbi:MAG: hypothetical protein IPO92_19310 [Saprospiraceae bacterium]|nr:hypothetical protein [Saprospiraceae bacterium]
MLAYFKDDLFFSVIFVTAYQQYAVEAFRFSAVDYLMKPVDPDELATAVQKINKDSVLIKKPNRYNH